MTIELVTGAPGAGKTCYAVSQRIVPQAEARVTVEVDGQPVEVQRRVVVCGIRGLVAPHERLPHPLTGDPVVKGDLAKWNATDANDEPVHKRLPGEPPRDDVPATLYNWWLWCKPGDLIVIDECQFLIERGTLNREPPYYLRALSIHRHYGVDFLFITQAPEFLDSHVRKLVNPHRHVRSVLGFPVCMVYVWDHASNTERISTASKDKYTRRASHYRLYKSSVAHTKAPVGGRGGAAVAVLLVCLALGGGWWFSKRFTAPPSPELARSSVPAAPAGGVSPFLPPGAPPPMSAASAAARLVRVAGCMAWGDECRCVDGRGVRVHLAPWQCREGSTGFTGPVSWEAREVPVQAPSPSAPAASAPLLPFVAPGAM